MRLWLAAVACCCLSGAAPQMQPYAVAQPDAPACVEPGAWMRATGGLCEYDTYPAHPTARLSSVATLRSSLLRAIEATGLGGRECTAALTRAVCAGLVPGCTPAVELVVGCASVCEQYRVACSAALAVAAPTQPELDCRSWTVNSKCSAFSYTYPCLSQSSDGLPSGAAANASSAPALPSLCQLSSPHPLLNRSRDLDELQRPDTNTFGEIGGKTYATVMWTVVFAVVLATSFVFTPRRRAGDATDGGEAAAAERRLSAGERVFSIRFCSQVVSMVLTCVACLVVFLLATNQVAEDLEVGYDQAHALQERMLQTSHASAKALATTTVRGASGHARSVLQAHLDSVHMTHSLYLRTLTGNATRPEVMVAAFAVFAAGGSGDSSSPPLFYTQTKSVDDVVDRVYAASATQELASYPPPPPPSGGGGAGALLGVEYARMRFAVRPAVFDEATGVRRVPAGGDADPLPAFWGSVAGLQNNVGGDETWSAVPRGKSVWEQPRVNFGRASIGVETTLHMPPSYAVPVWTVTTAGLLAPVGAALLRNVVTLENQRVVISENTTAAALLVAASHTSGVLPDRRNAATLYNHADEVALRLTLALLKKLGITHLHDASRPLPLDVVHEVDDAVWGERYLVVVAAAQHLGKQFLVWSFVSVWSVEGDVVRGGLDLRRDFQKSENAIKDNEEESTRFLLFVSLMVIFLAIVLSLVMASTATAALLTVVEDLQDVGTFHLGSIQQRHAKKPLSKLTEVHQLQKSVQQTVTQLLDYRNKYPSLAFAVKAISEGHARSRPGASVPAVARPLGHDHELEEEEDLEAGVLGGVGGNHLLDVSTRAGELAKERTCKVTVVYLSRHALKRQDRKTKGGGGSSAAAVRKKASVASNGYESWSDSGSAGSDRGSEKKREKEVAKLAKVMKKTRTFDWHYTDPWTASLPKLLQDVRSALGECVGEPLELTAIMHQAREVGTPKATSPTAARRRRTFVGTDFDAENPAFAGTTEDAQEYPLRTSHHLQDFLQVSPDEVTIHVKKNSRTNVIAPLTALASVCGKVSLTLFGFKMYVGGESSGLRLAPVLAAILVVGFVLNIVWAFKLNRKATEMDEHMAEWTSSFQTETTVVMVLAGFNMQNLLVLWSGLRVGGLLRFHAPYPRKLRTQVIRWSMFSLIIGDLLPFIIVVYYLTETDRWGTDVTGRLALVFTVAAMLTGSVKKFVAFCLIDESELARKEQEEEEKRAKETKNSQLMPLNLTVLRFWLMYPYYTHGSTDVEGRALKASLGPKKMGANLRTFYTVVSKAVRLRGGLVEYAMDGELTAVFNHPTPTVDHEVLACSAAIEVTTARPTLHAASGSSYKSFVARKGFRKSMAAADENWLSASIVTGGFLKGTLRGDGRGHFQFIGERKNVSSVLLQKAVCSKGVHPILADRAVAEKVMENTDFLNECVARQVGTVALSTPGSSGSGPQAREPLYQIVWCAGMESAAAAAASGTSPLSIDTRGGDGPASAHQQHRVAVLRRSEVLFHDVFAFLDELALFVARGSGAQAAALAAEQEALPRHALATVGEGFRAVPFPAAPAPAHVQHSFRQLTDRVSAHKRELVVVDETDPVVDLVASKLEAARERWRAFCAQPTAAAGPGLLLGAHPEVACVCGRPVETTASQQLAAISSPSSPLVFPPVPGKANCESAFADFVSEEVRSITSPGPTTPPGAAPPPSQTHEQPLLPRTQTLPQPPQQTQSLPSLVVPGSAGSGATTPAFRAVAAAAAAAAKTRDGHSPPMPPPARRVGRRLSPLFPQPQNESFGRGAGVWFEAPAGAGGGDESPQESVAGDGRSASNMSFRAVGGSDDGTVRSRRSIVASASAMLGIDSPLSPPSGAGAGAAGSGGGGGGGRGAMLQDSFSAPSSTGGSSTLPARRRLAPSRGSLPPAPTVRMSSGVNFG